MDTESIHLIATDPPFNKNRDFHATPNSLKLARGAKFEDRWRWDEDVHEEWVDQIRDDWPGVWLVIEAARAASGQDMAAFLCWLGVRLMEMRRVLRDDGSIYLHIDHTAHAWCKALMDAIFGRRNFRNEIVWAYTGPSNTKRWFPRKHDTILFYTKSNEWTFNGDDVRVEYVKLDTGKTSGIFKSRATLSSDGKIPEDCWIEQRDGMTPVGRISGERTGYPTQKPLALYERIIKASSNPGDIVLDPFAGCATTPIAAERLGRGWVAIDIWEGAVELVRQRLEDNRQLIGDIPRIVYTDTPPERTDENGVAVPDLKLKTQYALESWQRLPHRVIVEHLVKAQSSAGLVICAGCGRLMEREFMQLDHLMPRADNGVNDISNRILLCVHCNGRKGAHLTMTGLLRDNRRSGWMKDEAQAELARGSAQAKAQEVRYSEHPERVDGAINP